MDGNGVTRREFEELRQELRDLRSEMRRLDREGSAVTRRLGDRVDAFREDFKEFKEGPFKDQADLNKWILRGFIAAFVLAVIVALVLQNRGA